MASAASWLGSRCHSSRLCPRRDVKIFIHWCVSYKSIRVFQLFSEGSLLNAPSTGCEDFSRWEWPSRCLGYDPEVGTSRISILLSLRPTKLTGGIRDTGASPTDAGKGAAGPSEPHSSPTNLGWLEECFQAQSLGGRLSRPARRMLLYKQDPNVNFRACIILSSFLSLSFFSSSPYHETLLSSLCPVRKFSHGLAWL